MAIASNFPAIRPSLNLDFANAKALDPRITFSRASAATYYDGKTVAKAEENLLLYSQEIDNAAWTKLGATVVANAAIAPDGTITADKLIDSTADSAHYVSQAVGSAGIQCVFSIYAKAAELSWIRLTWSGFSNAAVYFDLASGVIGTTTGSLSPIGVIQNVGNGWYRCSMLVTPTSTSGVFIASATGDNVPTYLGTGSQGVLLWGAQLEQRSQVTAYTPTTTQPITNYIPVLQTAPAGVPRFDHNPVTGESLGLLVEEQRTNLLTYSEFWTGGSGTGLATASFMFGPSGSYANAIAFGHDGVTNSYLYKAAGLVEGVTYAMSVYVKMEDGGAPAFGSSTPSSALNDFALILAGGGADPTKYVVAQAGNGLYRVSFSLTAGAATLSNNGVLKYSSNSNRKFKTTGWQIEAGAFPTSYIKTEASQVTRAVDSASMTGANFSSWYRQDEGTIFVEAEVPGAPSGTNYEFFNIGDGTASGTNSIISRVNNGTTRVMSYGAYQGVAQFTLPDSKVFPEKSFAKVSLSYKTNEVSASVSAGAPLTDTSVNPPVVNSLYLGGYAQRLNGHVKRFTFYPKAFPNNIQALTA